MAEITQKQLIGSLKQLKEIKPRKEWAVLLKSQILTEKKPVEISAKKVGIMDVFSSMFFQKKFAYSFAVLTFIVIGLIGLSNYSNSKPDNSKKLAQHSQASLTGQIAFVSALAKSLKDNPTKDPQTIKDIAVSLKTLADVPGTDLTTNSEVRDLYQTVVENQIADLQKTTLTDSQKNILTEAEDLYNQGKYTDALEKILSINK